MLNVEDNETITHVGPGTPMGKLMREYWLPVLLSSEVAHPNCDPVRLRMLGEDLIAFRDTSGEVGVIQNLCPHRGASLFLGRNEDHGIRCAYHAWKFDIHGNCVDLPSEPPESPLKERVRATTYPCVERGGAVYIYMGTREVPPPLPRIEAWEAPEGATTIARQTPCNWLQVLEGNIDTVHAAFLHRGAIEPEWYQEGSFEYYAIKQRWALFEVADTPGGAIYGACRPGTPGHNYWRIGKFDFPCWSTAAAGVMGYTQTDSCFVPMDDTHTMVFTISVNGKRDRYRSRAAHRPGADELPQEPEILPNTTDWYGRFQATYNLENDWLIDRERARSLWSFFGAPYVTPNEDRAVQESMGPILPREIEHLGTSDILVNRVRRRFLNALRALARGEGSPPAVDNPDAYLGRVGQVMIPEDANWLEYTEKLRTPFIENTPLDPALLAGPVNSPNGTRYVRHERPGPLF